MAQDELPNSLARQLEQLRASIRGTGGGGGGGSSSAAPPAMKAQTPNAGPHVHFGPTTVRPIPASSGFSSGGIGGVGGGAAALKGSFKKYGKVLIMVLVVVIAVVIYIKIKKRPKPRPVPVPPIQIPPPRPPNMNAYGSPPPPPPPPPPPAAPKAPVVVAPPGTKMFGKLEDEIKEAIEAEQELLKFLAQLQVSCFDDEDRAIVLSKIVMTRDKREKLEAQLVKKREIYRNLVQKVEARLEDREKVLEQETLWQKFPDILEFFVEKQHQSGLELELALKKLED